jgi:hypothetical protein
MKCTSTVNPFDLSPMDVAVFHGKKSESPAKSALICGAQRRVTLLSASTARHATAVRTGGKIAVVAGLALSQAGGGSSTTR